MVKKKIKKPAKKNPVKKEKKKKVNNTQLAMMKYEIDIDQLLLHTRELYLYGEINTKSSFRLIRQLSGLAQLSNEPIALWINSPGGSVIDSFAIIDAIKGIKCPVYTIISGFACSGAGLISLAGDKRVITEYSRWMAHNMACGGYDDADKFFTRTDEYHKPLHKQIFQFYRDHTKLTEADLEKARYKELWLTPKEAEEKGVVDGVVTYKGDKK